MAPMVEQDGGQHRQPRGEAVAAMLGNVFDFVIVRTVYVKSMTGHWLVLLESAGELIGQGRILALTGTLAGLFRENRC